MIGSLVMRDGRTATMVDAGGWESADPRLAAVLNLGYGPGKEPVGAHHRPPGVARLTAAAADLGATVTLAVKPYPPLPDGQMS